jgi:chorismate mutase
MSIEDWRSEIDDIDDQLIRLLNARARLAAKIGGLKHKTGLPLNDLAGC